jgi:hypothetical protein
LDKASWYTPAIPVLGRLKQKDPEFKASLGFTVRHYFKKRRGEGRKAGPYFKIITMSIRFLKHKIVIK